MPPIIDADGHVTEPRALWQEFAAPAFRDRVIQVRREADGEDRLWWDGRSQGGSPAPACIPGAMADRSRHYCWDDLLPGGYDPARRLDVLDEEGIDQALLFPSLYLLYGNLTDVALADAACRAYNDWMADFCSRAPDRLYGAAIVPLQSVERAAREVERAASLGLRAVTIRPERYHGLALHDPACAPFFAAAERANVAVAVHGSFGSRMPSFATGRYQNPFFEHMICHPFEQMAACLDLVCGGVLDRFPALRVGFFESGLGWLLYWLERMDEHQETLGRFTPWLERRPSEAFREQCFVSMDTDNGKNLDAVASRGFARCVLWGSDYPHYDCIYPGAYKGLLESCRGVPDSVVREVTCENPRRFMGLGSSPSPRAR
jgi:predicted TIM-barrel fold metal-dependent hydrolase